MLLEFLTLSALGKATEFIGLAAVGGVLGNRSDDKAKTSWQQFRENLKQYRPDANHELNRAIYQSYLQATLQICATRAESLRINIDLWFQAEAASSFLGKIRETVSRDKPLGILSAAEHQFLEKLVKDLYAELSLLAEGKAELPSQYQKTELDALMHESELLMQPQDAGERLRQIRESLCVRLLDDLERKYGAEFGKPFDEFKRLVDEQWFDYLCACFQFFVKHQPHIANAFHSKLLAKITVRDEAGREQEITPAIIEAQLAAFGGEMVERLERTLLWMEQEQREGFERVENLLKVMLPLLATVSDEARRDDLFRLIRGESQRVIDELGAVTREEGEKNRAATQEVGERTLTAITNLEQQIQPRVEEKAIDVVNLPSLDPTVYDRDDECEIVLRALRGEMGAGKVSLVVVPSTFGKTYLAIKVLKQVTDGQRITVADVRKILYVDCRRMSVPDIVQDFGRLMGQSQHIAQAFGKREAEPLADWLGTHIFQPLQALGTTWLFLDNFEEWLDEKQDYRVNRIAGSADDVQKNGDEIEQFILSFFVKNHDVRVLMLSQAKPTLTGIHAPRELEAIGKAMYQGLPKTDETDFALDYLRTEGADVGLHETKEEMLLAFVDLVQRNPMALASLVNYLGEVKDVYTFEELVGKGNLFAELDKYQHVEDRTKYLIKKQIAAQSDEMKILLCALAFFDRPLPREALEIFLPDKAAENISRLVTHKLATLTIGVRGTRRYELHAFFSELTRQDEFYARFCSILNETLAVHFLQKGNEAYEATYFRRAIDLYDCAVAIYRFLGSKELANDLAMAYLNKGVALRNLGQFAAAIAEYDKAIAIRERLVNEEGRGELANDLAMAYMNKGVALDNLGQFAAAIAEYGRAIAILEPLVNHGRSELADDLAMAYANKASSLTDFSEWTEALAYYDQAAQLWEVLIQEAGRFELLSSWVKVNRGRLLLLTKLEQWEEAAARVIEVLSLFTRLMQLGQVPNPDAATQEYAYFILTLREWGESEREKLYAAAGDSAEVLRKIIEG